MLNFVKRNPIPALGLTLLALSLVFYWLAKHWWQVGDILLSISALLFLFGMILFAIRGDVQ
jgi:hypothetical protein